VVAPHRIRWVRGTASNPLQTHVERRTTPDPQGYRAHRQHPCCVDRYVVRPPLPARIRLLTPGGRQAKPRIYFEGRRIVGHGDELEKHDTITICGSACGPAADRRDCRRGQRPRTRGLSAPSRRCGRPCSERCGEPPGAKTGQDIVSPVGTKHGLSRHTHLIFCV
jgi:hypothetical protein